jgi:rod shape-determining protein MreD
MAGARPMAPWRWIGVPIVQCLILTVIFSLPFRPFGLSLPEPIFPMVPAFAWAVIRPSMLAPAGVLVMGLFLDILWGAPLGLWALSLLLVYGAGLVGRSMMAGQSFPVMWAWYAAATGLVLGAAFLFTMVGAHATADPIAIAWQFLATVILFPFAHLLIDRFEDADVRFR